MRGPLVHPREHSGSSVRVLTTGTVRRSYRVHADKNDPGAVLDVLPDRGSGDTRAGTTTPRDPVSRLPLFCGGSSPTEGRGCPRGDVPEELRWTSFRRG